MANKHASTAFAYKGTILFICYTINPYHYCQKMLKTESILVSDYHSQK